MAKRFDPAIVTIAGTADIKTAAKLHKQLLLAFRKNGSVELDISKATDFDLTFVQSVEAARRFAATQKRSFSLSAPAPGVLEQILWRGGFLSNADDSSFWLAGGR